MKITLAYAEELVNAPNITKQDTTGYLDLSSTNHRNMLRKRKKETHAPHTVSQQINILQNKIALTCIYRIYQCCIHKSQEAATFHLEVNFGAW